MIDWNSTKPAQTTSIKLAILGGHSVEFWKKRTVDGAVGVSTGLTSADLGLGEESVIPDKSLSIIRLWAWRTEFPKIYGNASSGRSPINNKPQPHWGLGAESLAF